MQKEPTASKASLGVGRGRGCSRQRPCSARNPGSDAVEQTAEAEFEAFVATLSGAGIDTFDEDADEAREQA